MSDDNPDAYKPTTSDARQKPNHQNIQRNSKRCSRIRDRRVPADKSLQKKQTNQVYQKVYSNKYTIEVQRWRTGHRPAQLPYNGTCTVNSFITKGRNMG